MQRVCGQVTPVGGVVLPILSSPSPLKMVVGNWSLVCQNEGEMTIHNSDGTRVSVCVCVYGKGSCHVQTNIRLIGDGKIVLSIRVLIIFIFYVVN